jgi:hypothetical protein
MKFPSNKNYITLNKGNGNNKIKVVTTIFLGLQTKGKMEKGTLEYHSQNSSSLFPTQFAKLRFPHYYTVVL